MAMGDDYEDIADEGRPLRDLDDLDRRGGRNDRGRNGRRRQRGDDEEYMDRKSARGGMTRLFINLGKNQNVKPGDILGAIAGESGIPGRLVGSIDMYDKYTFVEVPKEQADNGRYEPCEDQGQERACGEGEPEIRAVLL